MVNAHVAFGGELFGGPSAQRRCDRLVRDLALARLARKFVVRLDQQPRLRFLTGLAAHSDEMPAPLEAAAVEGKFQMPFGEARCGSPCGVHRPRSHTIIAPPPYSPFGILPSKVRYSIG